MSEHVAAEYFGCAVCWPESAEEASEATPGLEVLCWLIDESHYIIKTVKCSACGQHFVTVFTERVDWVDGDDPCTRSRLPVTRSELSHLSASEEDLALLAPSRRCLCADSPKGEPTKVSWRLGLSVGPHD